MHPFVSLLPLLAALTSAAPPPPLVSVSPDPPKDVLNNIQQQALGTYPNSDAPATLQPSSCTAFQVIAFNEIHEVAFFTELLAKISAPHPGQFDIHNPKKKELAIKTITAIIAQEELHAINAQTVLAKVCKLPIIQPCTYQYTYNSFDEAIALASTFTDVVLGTLSDTQGLFATNKDNGVIPLVGSVIGQEGEQDGYFRSLLGKVPSALPFLTGGSGRFAFSAINQNFVVPRSCPQDNFNTIKVPALGKLVLDEKSAPAVSACKQTLSFKLTDTAVKPVNDCSGLSIVYINQQNKPVVRPLSKTCQAEFPYDKDTMAFNGLTLAAVTPSAGPFKDPDAVAAAATFGPALIEVGLI
ncbi:MAG: hypothetical protein Q9160_004020 [Pyrenula sp. 1 TL-2023]